MATSKNGPVTPRVKTLHISTAQGYAGLLSKDGQHVFSYAPDVVAENDGSRSISLTMPVRAESYATTPMLPAFQTFLPEGYLANRIVEKFSKMMRVDDMALLALSGGSAIGRIRVSQSREIDVDNSGVESLKEILGSTGSKDLFEYLCDRYLIASGIAGVQPKVMIEAEDDLPTSTEGKKNRTYAPKTPGERSNSSRGRQDRRGRVEALRWRGNAESVAITPSVRHTPVLKESRPSAA